MPSYQPVSHFIGRDEERAFLRDHLRPNRIVTLCGPGGMGKTSLMRWAINDPEIMARFPDGVFIHPFYQEPLAEQAFGSIARHFGLEPGPDARAAATQALAQRRLLLVLDGAEAADDLRAVVQVRGSQCGLLITSQNRDHILDKHWDITPLPDYRSRELVERWAGGKRLNEAALDAIRGFMGDLPLALRLVGSYLLATRLSPAEYLQLPEMEQLQAITDRQSIERNLTVVLEHTFKQLPSTGQEAWGLLGRLALAPFDGQEVAAVLGQGAGAALRQLVQFGLLAREEDGRYVVSHALVYRYAHQFLPVPPGAVAQLANYYAQLAERESKRGLAGYQALDKVRPHLLACLEACAQAEAWQECIALVWSVDDYLDLRGYWLEYRRALEHGITAAHQFEQKYDEEALLSHLGMVYSLLGEIDRAITCFDQALVVNRDTGYKKGRGNILGNLGLAYKDLGETERAINYMQQALTIAQEIGDKLGESNRLSNLGLAYADLGKTEKAMDYYQQALVIANEIGEKRGKGVTLGNLGLGFLTLGDVEKSIDHFQQALIAAHEIGDKQSEGLWFGNLGNANYLLGHVREAKAHYELALGIAEMIGDRRVAAQWAWNLGLLLEENNPAQAIALMSRLVAYNEEIGHPDAAAHAERVAAIRRRLNPPPPS